MSDPPPAPDAAGAAGAGALDRLFAAYMVVSAAALLFPHRPAAWPLLLAAHAAAALLALGAGPAGSLRRAAARAAPRLSAFVAGWYPLLLVPALYAELAPLNRAVHDGRYFDETILAWEQALLGWQPSRPADGLAAALPLPWLSEALHFAYLSYYAIIYLPVLWLWLRGRDDAFRLAVFALMLAFFAHYVFFIYFPVQGPRYLFDPPGGALADGFFFNLVHGILEAGSSQGAAFPSSHVGVSVAITAVAARALPRAFPLLAVLTVGLALGAVYGGFHYAVDALAGALLGLAAAIAAPRLRRALAP